ncbi:MAG: TRAP transporter small permease [Christensenellales bacterium]|nr:TRAP transporter small permease [Christensenellales bacterium]
MNRLKKIGAAMEKLYMAVGAATMGLLAFLVIFTVIMRYCFSLSWKSVSEFNVLLFTFTTFWGMGLNVLQGEHVSINILYDKIKPSVKRWVSVFNYAVMLVVDVLFVHYGWMYAVKMGKQLSMGMEIPMFYMYSIMPACGVICAVCIVFKAIDAVFAPVSAFEVTEKPLE